MNAALSYDLLCLVVDALDGDLATLSRCAFVSRDFNRAASSHLYRSVTISPRYRQSLEAPLEVLSATLPRNRLHVQAFTIEGLMSPQEPLPTEYESKLIDAVQAFEHLHTVKLAPTIYPEDVFAKLIPQLEQKLSLTDLHVNASCMAEATAPMLVKIKGLRRLVLESPTRALLHLLPDWLQCLGPTLTQLHLLSNCGSITPGLLRSFIPFLANVRAFSFGLSYSVTNEDLFGSLGQLPSLEDAAVQHYPQRKNAENAAPMELLKSFTALHGPAETQDFEEADRLCSWVCAAISGAKMERISVQGDYFAESLFTPRVFDALVEVLSETQYTTLTALDLSGWLVNATSIGRLIDTCKLLEELTLALDTPGFEEFERKLPDALRLHTTHIRIYSMAGGMFTMERATSLMRSSALRRLTVNGHCFEAAWALNQNGAAHFRVQELVKTEDTVDDAVLEEEDDSSDDGSTCYHAGDLGAIPEEEEESEDFDLYEQGLDAFRFEARSLDGIPTLAASDSLKED